LAGHALAQVPQLSCDELGSTQTPEQLICPVGHMLGSSPGTQRCATQAKCLGQPAPPVSQYNSSVREHDHSHSIATHAPALRSEKGSRGIANAQ
jgi:hypothetical protein